MTLFVFFSVKRMYYCLLADYKCFLLKQAILTQKRATQRTAVYSAGKFENLGCCPYLGLLGSEC